MPTKKIDIEYVPNKSTEDEQAQPSKTQQKSSGDQDKEKDGKEKGSAQNTSKQVPPPTILSWSIRGFSVLLIVALLGYFIYSWAKPTVMPQIEFTPLVEKIEQRGTGWAVPVKIVNKGTMSVHALSVRGTLTAVAEQPAETLDILLLGPNEQVQGTLWYDQDPRGKGLEMSVCSYLLP